MKFRDHVIALLFFVLSCHAADFDFGTRGILSVTIPVDWYINGKEVTMPDGTPTGFVFAIKPRSDAHANCQLSFAYVLNGAPNKNAIQQEVLRICKPFARESVEKKENLTEYSLETGFGAYCLFTDASLVGKKMSPGEYKVMATGEVQPGDNMLGVVTLLADDPNGAELGTMIKIIDSLKLRPKPDHSPESAPSAVH